MGKKPFIDKKSAKHYHVLHRSQKDPLINDTEAPDRVLQEVLPKNLIKVSGLLIIK
jgi:protein LTV1